MSTQASQRFHRQVAFHWVTASPPQTQDTQETQDASHELATQKHEEPVVEADLATQNYEGRVFEADLSTQDYRQMGCGQGWCPEDRRLIEGYVADKVGPAGVVQV